VFISSDEALAFYTPLMRRDCVHVNVARKEYFLTFNFLKTVEVKSMRMAKKNTKKCLKLIGYGY
jgi:hypothetical protein